MARPKVPIDVEGSVTEDGVFGAGVGIGMVRRNAIAGSFLRLLSYRDAARRSCPAVAPDGAWPAEGLPTKVPTSAQ